MYVFDQTNFMLIAMILFVFTKENCMIKIYFILFFFSILWSQSSHSKGIQ